VLVSGDKKRLILALTSLNNTEEAGDIVIYDVRTGKLAARSKGDLGIVRNTFLLQGGQKFAILSFNTGFSGKYTRNEALINIYNLRGERLYKHYYSTGADYRSSPDYIALSDDKKFLVIAAGDEVFPYYAPEYFLSDILNK